MIEHVADSVVQIASWIFFLICAHKDFGNLGGEKVKLEVAAVPVQRHDASVRQCKTELSAFKPSGRRTYETGNYFLSPVKLTQ